MVVERDDDSADTARRQTMQQAFGLKRLVVTHVGATALALGVLVGSGLAMVGLTTTGNAPWMFGGSAQVGAQQSAVQSMHTAQEARFFEAKLARQDALSSLSPTASTPGELTPAQLLAKYRQYNPTVGGPESSALGRLLRDYARYNPSMDAAPAPTASTTTRQWRASPLHIGFMGLRFVACASPDEETLISSHAESWTLLADLIPVRLWH
jgi:hypothetical protein